MSPRGHRFRIHLLRASLVIAVGLAVGGLGWAQQVPGGLIRHDTGQGVSPVYEGWYRTPDGRIEASFGYFNRNYEERLHVPVGPDNRITPGPADQGQPTYFLPRRQVGVFTIELPPDATEEVTWTLSLRGQTMEIPVNLDEEYLIEPYQAAAGRSPGNTPPVVRWDEDGEGVQGPSGTSTTRTARVGEPLRLDVWVTDDGLGSGDETPELEVRWTLYRGAGDVVFTGDAPEIVDGRATTTATFETSGSYTLRVLATDGSSQGDQCCWTNGYVDVTVED